MNKPFKTFYEESMKKTLDELNVLYLNWLKKIDDVIMKVLVESEKTEKYAKTRKARTRRIPSY